MQWRDYATLHRYVMESQPGRVIEYGSGNTSLVIAHALKAGGGHLWTLEESQTFFGPFQNTIPANLADLITPILAPSVADTFRDVWGVRYDVAPDGPFDMAFVDGPVPIKEGRRGACLDILFEIERHPNHPMTIFVDGRHDTVAAMATFIPGVRYDQVFNFTRIDVRPAPTTQ